MDEEMIFKLETADTRRRGTVRRTTYSAIFVRRNSQKINDTEQRVIQMIETDPACWRCGCVTRYPDTMFTQNDQDLYAEYGLDRRFEI